MKNIFGSIFLAFMLLAIFLSGCIPGLTPITPSPSPISPTFTREPTITPSATATPSLLKILDAPVISVDNLTNLSLTKSIEVPPNLGNRPSTGFRFRKATNGDPIVMLYSYESYTMGSLEINLASEEIGEWIGGITNEDTKVISPDKRFLAIQQEQSLKPRLLIQNLIDNTGLYLVNTCNQPSNFPGCVLRPGAFTSDGHFLVTTLNIQGSWYGNPKLPISVWDTTKGAMVSQYSERGGQNYHFLAFAPDEQSFLTFSAKFPGTLRWELFNLTPLERKWVVDTKQGGQSNHIAAFAPNQKIVAVAHHGDIWLLNFDDGKIIKKLEFTGVPTGLTFSSDSSLVFAILGGSDNGRKVQVFSSSTGEPVGSFYTEFAVNNLSMSPDGKYILMTRATLDYEKPANQLDIYTVKP